MSPAWRNLLVQTYDTMPGAASVISTMQHQRTPGHRLCCSAITVWGCGGVVGGIISSCCGADCLMHLVKHAPYLLGHTIDPVSFSIKMSKLVELALKNTTSVGRVVINGLHHRRHVFNEPGWRGCSKTFTGTLCAARVHAMRNRLHI